MSFTFHENDIFALAERFKLSASKMRDVAFYMHQLVEDRFRTQGASGGAPWPAKKLKSWGYDDGRAILTGTTGILRKSFSAVSTDTQAVVGSWAPYSVLHQLGCVGKGGLLPDIVPKRAKALFIPITDRAAKSVRFIGPQAATLRLAHRIAATAERLVSPYRAGTKSSRATKTTSFVALKRGRLHKGKLEVWDARVGKYKSGIPDFIFLRRVSVPPRPMLPTSSDELRKITEFFGARLLRKQP